MKIYFAFLVLCVLTFSGQAQTNLVFTNDVAIGNSNWFPAMHFSLGNKNRMELEAEDTNYLRIWNTITNVNYDLFIPAYGIHWSLSFFLQLKLITTNGVIILPTTQGKPFTTEPKGRPKRIVGIARSNAYEIPKLTHLFKFPTNGEYILEARVRWWSPKDKSLLLSDPVRLKVIKENINSTNAPTRE